MRRYGADTHSDEGSDYPLDDPLGAIQAAGQLGFGEPELQAILHDNAASLPGQQ
jgi:predicted TIM-barrel fold metal-dependent hydrolase